MPARSRSTSNRRSSRASGGRPEIGPMQPRTAEQPPPLSRLDAAILGELEAGREPDLQCLSVSHPEAAAQLPKRLAELQLAHDLVWVLIGEALVEQPTQATAASPLVTLPALSSSTAP